MRGRWWISVVAVMAGSTWLGVGAALAGPVGPVAASPNAPTVTLSALLTSGEDVADHYLPEVTINTDGTVTGKDVTLRINGAPGRTFTINPSFTAWPGTCTNFSAPRALGAQSSDTDAQGNPKPDFTLSASNVLTSLDAASNTLRSEASALGSNLSIVQIRQDFSKNLINVLQTGASNLTLADTNEEAANSQALSTRQSIAVSALALANQSQASVLQLLR